MRLKDLRERLEYRLKQQSLAQNFEVAHNEELSLAVKHHVNVRKKWRETFFLDTITTTANEPVHVFSHRVGRFISIWHQEYGRVQPIKLIPTSKFYESGIDTSTSNHPFVGVQDLTNGVLSQITSATTVSVVSTSVSDTGDVTVFGIVDGSLDKETVTLTGITAVTTTKTFSEVHRISKGFSSVGRITLSAGSTTLAILPAGHFYNSLRYKRIRFYPIPSSAITIYYIAREKQYDLVDDEDVPIVSDDHDEAILLRAEYQITGVKSVLDKYEDEVRKLVSEESGNFAESQEITDNIMPFRVRGPLSYGGQFEGIYGQ